MAIRGMITLLVSGCIAPNTKTEEKLLVETIRMCRVIQGLGAE